VVLGFHPPCVCLAAAGTKWRESEMPERKRRDTEDNGATSFNVLFVRLELKKFWYCLDRNILALCSDLLCTLVLDLLLFFLPCWRRIHIYFCF
jgi:hypothetical protein